MQLNEKSQTSVNISQSGVCESNYVVFFGGGGGGSLYSVIHKYSFNIRIDILLCFMWAVWSWSLISIHVHATWWWNGQSALVVTCALSQFGFIFLWDVFSLCSRVKLKGFEFETLTTVEKAADLFKLQPNRRTTWLLNVNMVVSISKDLGDTTGPWVQIVPQLPHDFNKSREHKHDVSSHRVMVTEGFDLPKHGGRRL